MSGINRYLKQPAKGEMMFAVKDSIDKVTKAERRLSDTCINCGADKSFQEKKGHHWWATIYCNNCGYWEYYND